MKGVIALFCLLSLALSGCARQSHYADEMKQAPHDVEVSSLGQQSAATVRHRLLQHYQVWQGVPYRLGGNDKQGIDCSSFTQQTFRQQFGIALPRTTQAQARVGERLEPALLSPGDLLFYRSLVKVRHVGIYLGQGEFLHASTSQGVIISKVDNPYWAGHFWQARRLR